MKASKKTYHSFWKTKKWKSDGRGDEGKDGGEFEELHDELTCLVTFRWMGALKLTFFFCNDEEQGRAVREVV
jgi:hypothetical protein